MNIDHTIIAQTSAAFGALDFTEESESIVAIDASMAATSAASERARARIEELQRLIRDRRDELQPDGKAAAEALFEGEDARSAAKRTASLLDMQEEAATLAAAWKELRWKMEELQQLRSATISTAHQKAAMAVGPVVEALMAELAGVAETIADVRAGLFAVTAATGAYSEAGRKAEAVLLAMEPVIGARASIPVPAEISELLAGLAGKGAALQVRLPEQAPWPQYQPPIGMIYGALHRAA